MKFQNVLCNMYNIYIKDFYGKRTNTFMNHCINICNKVKYRFIEAGLLLKWNTNNKNISCIFRNTYWNRSSSYTELLHKCVKPFENYLFDRKIIYREVRQRLILNIKVRRKVHLDIHPIWRYFRVTAYFVL